VDPTLPYPLSWYGPLTYRRCGSHSWLVIAVSPMTVLADPENELLNPEQDLLDAAPTLQVREHSSAVEHCGALCHLPCHVSVL